MRHCKNSLYIIIALMFLVYVFVACSKQNNSSIGVINNAIDNTIVTFSTQIDNSGPTDKQTQKTEIDVEKLRKAIKAAINNDLWYNGKFSDFTGFEMQSSGIEIYKRDKSPEDIYVNFRKQFEKKESDGSANDGFYCIIILNTSKNGYSSELGGYWMRPTEEETKKELDTLKCELVQKSTITFEMITQPTFTDLSGNGINNLNELNLRLPELMQEQGGFEKGIYKSYIRKFSDSDSKTYVIIEDSRDNSWIVSIYFDESGNITVDKIYDVNLDIRRYKADQIKKVSYSAEKFILN